jgi:hypothetical protein
MPGACRNPQRKSVYDEKLRARGTAGTVRRIAVADLIALALLQDESLPIAQLDIQHTAEAEHHVALRAPVIGEVTGRVLDHAHPDFAEVPGSPKRKSRLAGMLRGRDPGPVRDGHR